MSSREVEFQNWKRRKSYDPMKAAAEGKKKEAAKKVSPLSTSMTQSSIVDSDNSPRYKKLKIFFPIMYVSVSGHFYFFFFFSKVQQQQTIFKHQKLFLHFYCGLEKFGVV